MERQYRERYEYLYRNHWWWRAREEIVVKQIRALGFTAASNRRILDIGCGNGLLFHRLAEIGIPEGIELDANLVTEDPKPGPVHVTPFEAWVPPHQFDLILMLDVLEHVQDDLYFLEKARAALRSDGVLLLTVPARPELFTSHDRINIHLRRYRKLELITLIKEAGFLVEKAHHLFFWPAIVKLAIRFFEEVFRKDIASDTVPSPILNKFLTCLTLIESNLMRAGVVPWGSSLLVVARPE